MDKKLDVTYGVVLTFEDDGISLEVPDLPGAFSCADTIEEAIGYAQEVIGLVLYDMDKYPKMTILDESKLEENQKVVYVNVFLPYQFAQTKEVYKNKMVTLPTWLESLAKTKNVNFSRVLQEGLKKELQIKD